MKKIKSELLCKWLIIILVCILLAAIKLIASNIANIQRLRSDIATKKNLLQKKQIAMQRNRIAQKKLHTLQSTFFKPDHPQAIEQTLPQLARQCGLTVLRLKNNRHIELAGPFEQRLAFILALAQTPQTIVLKSLQLSEKKLSITAQASPPTLSAVAFTPWIPHQKIQRNPFETHSPTVAAFAPLTQRRFLIHIANPTTLNQLIQNTPATLSKNGRSFALPQAHIIWALDTPAHLKKIARMISLLDHPQKPLYIEARIVNIDQHAAQSLGVDFAQTTLSNLLQATFSPTPWKNLAQVDVSLKALIRNGRAKIIARPHLYTLNHRAALIESGEEIPYQEKTGNGNTSIAFKKAVLRLKVTPSLLPNDQIYLDIQVNQDTLSNLTVNGVPAIRTQQLKTYAIVKKGALLTLGGILLKSRSDQSQGVPGLSRLPLIGPLFKLHEQALSTRELLIILKVTVPKEGIRI